jgi:NADH-quinone oxidoreductase subunit G
MTDDTVNIEIDGQPCRARRGQMIIEATDAMDAYVPRFCYHEKLSIAANCRMCLVEVESVPKPLPACATPVTEGMKIHTRSALAVSAQKATMEFLLINHPLDCPICDQGGECELQHISMGYGGDVSRYTERKRVVRDKDLGPLVSTDMTRCIHCTRCVRFGQEIAGIQELGTIGRGDRTEIGTYIERSVGHELSGNIIDLCPVGALNSKPFRYRARSWEMTQHETVAPHDCVGSNIYAHVRRGKLMRVVPRSNEAVNETWISDRDRFSYEGVYADDRLLVPMVRSKDGWRETDWETALQAAADGIRAKVESHGAQSLGILASPSATVEEHYLAGRLARAIGSDNIDHRLRRTDFSDQDAEPVYPGIGMSLESLGSLDSLLLVGCNVRDETPMLAHRVRSAALRGGRVGTLATRSQDLLFPVVAEAVHSSETLAGGLAAVLAALGPDVSVPETLREMVAGARPVSAHRALAEILVSDGDGALLLGLEAGRHPQAALLRALAATLAKSTGSRLGFVTEGANSAGAALAGALPNRGIGGVAVDTPGQSAAEMLAKPLSTYVLLSVEPEHDSAAGGAALETLAKADFVVSLTSYATDAMLDYAHVLLPVGTFAETTGTFVNCEGRWQSFLGAATPLGQSRPAWKVLRVLGNMLGLEGFDASDAAQVRNEVLDAVGRPEPDVSGLLMSGAVGGTVAGTGAGSATGYDDPVLRRAPALQAVSVGGDAAEAGPA